VLCAKDGLMQYVNILKFETKIGNFKDASSLNKRQFYLLFDQVNCRHKGLVKYNNVCWLTRGHLLKRFVECLHEMILIILEWQSK